MILIDANALVIIMVGLVDTNLLKTHRRTSIYEEQDFLSLLSVIQSFDRLVVLPNVWTEVDNLLNGFSRHHKDAYVRRFSETVRSSTEVYLPSELGVDLTAFVELGLTDSLLLEHGRQCELLITSDSRLSDYAKGYGIDVYDVVKARNERL